MNKKEKENITFGTNVTVLGSIFILIASIVLLNNPFL